LGSIANVLQNFSGNRNEKLNYLHKHIVPIANNALNAFSKILNEAMINIRVFCCSKNGSTTSMWYHYADKYKGVVFSFKSIDSEIANFKKQADSPIEMDYVNKHPGMLTADDWISFMLNINETNSTYSIEFQNQLVLRLLACKSEDWKPEDEIRFLLDLSKIQDKYKLTQVLNSDYYSTKLLEEEVAAIYLGPEISLRDEFAIISLLRMRNSLTPVYKTSFNDTQYGLNLTRLEYNTMIQWPY
jgi:hypothetical protein